MAKKGAGGLVEQTIQSFKDVYNKSDPATFWDTVKNLGDHYSVRQYLTQQ